MAAITAIRVIDKRTDAGVRWFVYRGGTKLTAGYQDEATARRVAQRMIKVLEG